MWFCEPLAQLEPLFVVVTFVVAVAALLPIILQVLLPDLSLISPTSRNSLLTLIVVDIPVAILGAAFALSYGWLPSKAGLSISAFSLVSAALLMVLIVYILIISEFVSPKVRNHLFLPQFKKAQAEDLEKLKYLKKDTGRDTTSA